MFSYIFPILANSNSNNIISNTEQTASLSLTVQIPCSGHAPLIVDELRKNNGVQKFILKCLIFLKLVITQKKFH